VNRFYQEMQLSGDVWLGEVPSLWKSYRIKDITLLSPNFSNGAPDKKELCSVIPMEKVSEKGVVTSNNVEEYSLITSGLTNFEAGDVIFAKITPCMENGKGAYVEKLPVQYALGSTEFHVLRPRYMVDGKFLYYYTYNSVYRDYAEVNMTGAAGQKRVSSRFINYTRIFLPNTQVQQRIAAYLNKTCAAIDKTIEAKQKQLEILDALRKSIIHKAVTRGLDDSVELKDSGVEWLGRIPRHWEVTKLKKQCEIIPSNVDKKSHDDEMEVKLCNYVDVYYNDFIDDSIEYMIATASEHELRKFQLVENDVLITKDSEDPFDIAVPAIVIKSQAKLLCGYHLSIIRSNNRNLIGIYLFWALKNRFIASQLHREATGITRWAIANKHVKNSIIPLPPREEQSKIAYFLNGKISEIQNIKKNIQNQISTLNQYRKSLIHECVTGKRRINEDLSSSK